MTLIFYPADREHPQAQLGGKASPLAALASFNLPIPDWFVLAPAACDASAMTRDVITLSESVKAELRAALGKLCPDGAPVAVRSSALDEDGIQHSFAGQLDSFSECTDR